MRQERTNFAPAMLAAVGLHLAVLVSGIIVWPFFGKPLNADSVTAVTLVSAPPALLRPAEEAPKATPAAAPEPTPEATPPPPPKPAPTPAPQPLAKPTPKPPPPQPKPVQQQGLDLSALTSSLDKAVKTSQKPTGWTKGPPTPETATAARDTQGQAEAATADAAAAVGARLNRIWIKQCDVAGFRNLDDIQVRFHLTPDGNLQGAPQVISPHQPNTAYQAASEAAVRAVYQATPFKELPRQTYAQWQNFVAVYQAKKACSS